MYILLLQKKLEQGEHIMNGQNLLSPKKVKDDDLIFEDKNLDEDEKTKLMSLSGVKQYPMRVKCATLSWHTLVSAFDENKEEVKTEN